MKTTPDMKTGEFSFRERAESFRFAFNGIRRFFITEHNAWIHLAATIAVFIAAGIFHVSRNEFIVLIIVTGFVWAAEIFNTAIEKIMDFITTERKPQIKYIKDLSAAAVLVASITALGTAAFIFIPKLF